MLEAGHPYSDARHALRAICPQPLLNWREARFYGRYGEVELHLIEFLCRRDADAIDVGANDGSYVHYMRRHARHVVAYEPMPTLAKALRRKFPRGVTVQPIALSDTTGSIELRMPVVDGRLARGGLGRARAYFDRLGYRGLFVHKGQLKPVERFSIPTMQDPANLPDLTGPLQARQRFGRYIYNFIFLPPDELQSTVWK